MISQVYVAELLTSFAFRTGRDVGVSTTFQHLKDSVGQAGITFLYTNFSVTKIKNTSVISVSK